MHDDEPETTTAEALRPAEASIQDISPAEAAAPTLKYNGERQVAASLGGIRADHVARYRWASQRVRRTDVVVDAGCGVGYGTRMLAEVAHNVVGVDNAPDALNYAAAHWCAENIRYALGDAHLIDQAAQDADVVVAFEVLEHIIDPAMFVRRASALLKPGGRLLMSAPNQTRTPHSIQLNPHHMRHFTLQDLTSLARAGGFAVRRVFSQDGPDGALSEGDEGTTILMEAVLPQGSVVRPDPNELAGTLARAGAAVATRADVIRRMQSDLTKTALLAEAVQQRNAPFGDPSTSLAPPSGPWSEAALLEMGALNRGRRLLGERLDEAERKLAAARRLVAALERRLEAANVEITIAADALAAADRKAAMQDKTLAERDSQIAALRERESERERELERLREAAPPRVSQLRRALRAVGLAPRRGAP